MLRFLPIPNVPNLRTVPVSLCVLPMKFLPDRFAALTQTRLLMEIASATVNATRPNLFTAARTVRATSNSAAPFVRTICPAGHNVYVKPMSILMSLTVLHANSPIPLKALAMTSLTGRPTTKNVMLTPAGNILTSSIQAMLTASGDAQAMSTLTAPNAMQAAVIPTTATSTTIPSLQAANTVAKQLPAPSAPQSAPSAGRITAVTEATTKPNTVVKKTGPIVPLNVKKVKPALKETVSPKDICRLHVLQMQTADPRASPDAVIPLITTNTVLAKQVSSISKHIGATGPSNVGGNNPLT